MRPNRGMGRRQVPQWLQAIGAVLARDAPRMPRDADGRLCRAWGVELDRASVHLVCVSAIRAGAGSVERISVDEVLHIPLPPGLVEGADILAPEDVGAVLRDALVGHPLSDPAASFSMALCPSVVLSRELAWASLLPGYTVSFPETSAVADALGPWIRWHAQRISGLEDADLLVDWRVSATDRSTLTLTAAQSHYLSVRDTLADHAGIRLHGLVDAAESALRACRFVVGHCLQPSGEGACDGVGRDPLDRIDPNAADVRKCTAAAAETAAAALERAEGAVRGVLCDDEMPWPLDDDTACARETVPFRLACVWCGETAAKAWTFVADQPGIAALSCALPAIESLGADAWRETLHAALRAPEHRPALLVVCGHESALSALGGMAALSQSCDFPVIRFDASTCRLHRDLSSAAAAVDCSVALGAALHGLVGGLLR